MNAKPDIRERLLAYGPQRLSDTELLAVLLHTGIANKPVTQLAEERYFGVYKIEVSGDAELTKNGTGNLFTVLEGQGHITVDDEVYDIKKGDSFILTTQCSSFLLDGDMLLIGSYDR